MRVGLWEHRLRPRNISRLALFPLSPITSVRNVTFINTSPVKRPLRALPSLTSEHSPIVFHSQSKNPYHNLSIEHYLLTHSDPSSIILFFYANRPSVVIGRNQNPWLECNLRWIQEGLPPLFQGWHGTVIPDHVPRVPVLGQRKHNVAVELVRRRSGGGTVFHDMGNLNYTVIVPNDKDFYRAKHAQMVVEALNALSVDGKTPYNFGEVKVNERNDIVMKKKDKGWFKISGTAFKLTRGRALHHGTLLFSSGNLSKISGLLKNPYRPYFEAKGVESVRSPVANLSTQSDPKLKNKMRRDIARAIVDQFWTMYGPEEQSKDDDGVEQTVKKPLRDCVQCQVDDDDVREQENPEIFRGVQELMSQEWRFGQTPRFSYKTGYSDHQEVTIEAKNGRAEIIKLADSRNKRAKTLEFAAGGIALHEVSDWKATLDPMFKSDLPLQTVQRLSQAFPVYTPPPNPKAKKKDEATEGSSYSPKSAVKTPPVNTEARDQEIAKDGSLNSNPSS